MLKENNIYILEKKKINKRKKKQPGKQLHFIHLDPIQNKTGYIKALIMNDISNDRR